MFEAAALSAFIRFLQRAFEHSYCFKCWETVRASAPQKLGLALSLEELAVIGVSSFGDVPSQQYLEEKAMEEEELLEAQTERLAMEAGQTEEMEALQLAGMEAVAVEAK